MTRIQAAEYTERRMTMEENRIPDVSEKSPWERAMGRVLMGIILTSFTFSFWCLDHILPAIGTVLMVLGFRALRKENPWFRSDYLLAAVRAGCVWVTLILNTTILPGLSSQGDGIWGLVSPSVATPLTTVADISEMFAYFSMTERQLLSLIHEGGSIKEILEKMPDVQLQLIDGTMYADSGRVETISGVIDQKTGSVNMRALFPNQRNILRSGGTGNVVFPNPMADVIMIPQSATTEIQDKKFVFVVQADNTLKNTEIQVFKLNDGKYYYVTEGLKAGDKVVIEGVQNLKNGATITPITPAEKEAEYQKALQDQKDGNIQTAFQ